MLVLFIGRTDCGPCKLIKPVFNKVKVDYPEFEFATIMADEDASNMAEHFGIKTVPTMVVINKESIDKYTAKEIGIQKRLREVLDAYKA